MIQNKVFCLLFLISLCGIRGVESACDGDLVTCFTNFTSSFGLDFPPDIDAYENTILNRVIGNLDRLCESYANLTKCITAANKTIDTSSMSCVYNTDDSTKRFVAKYYQLQFGCGNGLYQISSALNDGKNNYCSYCQNITQGFCNTLTSDCKNNKVTDCVMNKIANDYGNPIAYTFCQWENIYYKNASCSSAPDCNPYSSLWNTTQCFYNYFKAWGAPSSISRSSDNFNNFFQTYAIASTDGYNAACDRYNEFYKCIGGTDDAFNTLNFAQILTDEFNNDTANAWISVFKQQDFICSNGVDGLEELMECDVSDSICSTLTDNCNDTVTKFNCQNQLTNYKCGKSAAYYQCTKSQYFLKYSNPCQDATLDCGQYSSGSAVGIGMTLIFSFLIVLLN